MDDEAEEAVPVVEAEEVVPAIEAEVDPVVEVDEAADEVDEAVDDGYTSGIASAAPGTE